MIEITNAKEEIIEILEKCNKCGLCKELCPIFRILRDEQYSPRGHAILLSNKIIEKIVFDCTLCKACEQKCPFKLRICDAIKKARFVFNNLKEENSDNKKAVKRIMEGKNPYKED